MGKGWLLAIIGCTEISLSISQHINTVDGKSLKSRTGSATIVQGAIIQGDSSPRRLLSMEDSSRRDH